MPRCYQCGNTNAFISELDTNKLYCSDCFHQNLDDEISLGVQAQLSGHSITCSLQYHKTYNCICKQKGEQKHAIS